MSQGVLGCSSLVTSKLVGWMGVQTVGTSFSHSLTNRRVARPTHKLIPQDPKLCSREWFGEDVCDLRFGRNVFDVDELCLDLTAEVVEANQQVLGAGTRLVVRCDFKAALVVFKHFTHHARGCVESRESIRSQFR